MPKRLILSVVSSQRDSLGANYTYAFTDGVASIGREETCEWHLPDSAVSRRHAAVRLLNGTFFIEDFSTNGTFVGGSDESHRLIKSQPRPLRNGDRILVGDYEIVAAIEESGAAAPGDDATAVERGPASATGSPPPAADQGVVPPQSAVDAPVPPELPPVPAVEGETDPLKLLGVPPSPGGGSGGAPIPPQSAGGELPQGSALGEPMPPLPPLTPSPADGEIPNQIPADWWKQPAEPPQEPSGAPAVPPQAPAEPPQAVPPLPEPAAPKQAAPNPAPPQVQAPTGDDQALVRELVAGLMDVLNARAEIKRRFRVSMTMIQARENNPLKFAVDADEAMAKLFGGVSSGYLGADEAFQEAFRDLQAHQLAMLAGMREAFNNMLKQFDPYRLEVRFERTVGKGKLPFLRDRHWELYKELYDELTGDAEDSFHRLFGNTFAAAYEREMQKLIHNFKRGSRQ